MLKNNRQLPEYRPREKFNIWRMLTIIMVGILLVAATHNEQKIWNFLNGIKTDTVDESTTDAGVTVDGLLIKDGTASGMVADADFDANTILKADSDDTPVALTIAEQRIVGRITAGVITALTATEVRTMINVEDGADVTDATNVEASGALMDSDFSSNGMMARTGAGAYASRTITGTSDQIGVTNGDGSGNPTIYITNNPILGGNEAITLPKGTTGEQPGSPVEGMLRGNTSNNQAEYYDGSGWVPLGDVFGPASSTDHAAARFDLTTGKLLLDSAVIIDDSGNTSGINNLTIGNYMDIPEISTPANPASDVGRLYVKDNSSVTTLYFRDNAGSETNLLAGADTNKVLVSGDDTTPDYLVTKIPSGTGVTMTETGGGGNETLVPSLDITGLVSRTAFGSGDELAIYEAGVGIRKIDYDDLPGAAGGEANTASNAGSGTSLYYTKTGVDLEFNGIKSENDRIDISLDGVTHDIEVTLTEANIDLDNCDNTTSLFKSTRTGVYRTIYIDAGAMVPCTTNGAASGTNEYATNDIDMDYMAFDGGATEERIQFKFVAPDEWNRSTIKVKFWWSSATGSTTGDTVEWGIKAIAIGDNDVIDSALGTAQVISDTLLADNGTDMQTTSATPSLTVGGTPALGDLLIFEVYRNTDGTDDMAEDAWLFGVQIQYLESSTEPSAW